MAPAKNPAAMGKEIYKLLEKNKILLLQDKIFPSIVGEITGETVKGSWWGHPSGNAIYNGLTWLMQERPVLLVKLVDAKVTYLHESLFADFYSIVQKPRDWQLAKLKPEELKLYKFISQRSLTSADHPQLIEFTADPKKSLAVLEKKLLLCATETHTESGQHRKDFMPWKKSKIAAPKPPALPAATKKIEAIVADLCTKSGAKVKLPWQ